MSREPEQFDLVDWLAAQAASAVRFPEPGEAGAVQDAGQAADPTPSALPAAPVVLVRMDPSLNMHRFYSVALARSLFGEPGVERSWGRIGSPGRRRTDWHATQDAARAELETMVGRKRRRGYR